MKIQGHPTVALKVTIELTEVEAEALYAIAGYGTTEFLKCFYEHLGKAYLQKHEAGVHSLFDSVREELAPLLSRATEARNAFIRKSVSP